MFNNILTATDIVTTCDPTVSAAAELAKHDKAALSVLHVLESTYSGKYRNFVKHYETGEEIVVDDAYEQAVREKIDKNCAYFLKNLENFSFFYLLTLCSGMCRSGMINPLTQLGI